MKRTTMAWLLLALVTAVGCRSSVAEDPILQLGAGESLEQGKALMEKEKYSQARKYLAHAYEVEPNSAAGREALLLVADAHFLEGGDDNLIQAEAKYRDFQNRFPTSDRADYVQFQIGNALAGRAERPDRDQDVTRKAVQAYEDLQRLYPTSPYVAEARTKVAEVRDKLAEHEFQVGYFYYRFGLPKAAVDRLQGLLRDYPEYTRRDKALYWLGQSAERAKLPDDAKKAWDELRSQFPESKYVKEIPG